jgi:hypothetical protein
MVLYYHITYVYRLDLRMKTKKNEESISRSYSTQRLTLTIFRLHVDQRGWESDVNESRSIKNVNKYRKPIAAFGWNSRNNESSAYQSDSIVLDWRKPVRCTVCTVLEHCVPLYSLLFHALHGLRGFNGGGRE